jgi:crotonobetainyl-CoA:carnitine CoA-transferase CaiB-like acyl-CoA transferase
MLSDLGATVTKIELDRGDPYRSFEPQVNGVSLSAAVVNRGKASLSLDLRTASGRGRLKELVVDADVLLWSGRASSGARLGLGAADLLAINPGLVHVSISGYGNTGPYADRGAFDGIIQAESGVTWLDPGAGPTVLPTYLADKATSVMVVQATLAALLERERSGNGTAISVAMIDALAYFNFPDLLATYAPTSVVPTERPRAFSSTLIRAADGYVAIAPSSGAHIRSTCEALGHSEWVDELYALGRGEEFRTGLSERIESATRLLPADEVVRRLVAESVPASVASDADGHFAHPQVVHNETYRHGTDATLGDFRFPRYPALFDGQILPTDDRLSHRSTAVEASGVQVELDP